MSDYRVRFGGLDDACGAIQTAVSRMRSGLDELDSQVQQTIATWDGASREAYFARQREWTAAAGNIEAVLMQVKTAVGTSNQCAQDTESKNASILA